MSRLKSASALSAWMEVVDELDVVGRVEVLDLEGALDLLDPGLGRRDGLVLLVVEVVVLVLELGVLGLRAFRLDAAQAASDRAQVVVELGGVVGSPEMISGVRASSIRIESTSSTIA